MAVIINATTTTGLTTSADNSGVIQFQSNGANTVGISPTAYITIGGNQQIAGPAFSAYQSSAQTLSTTTWTKLLFQTEEFDTANCFANSTFTPNVAGYYQLSGGFAVATTAATSYAVIYKNGVLWKLLQYLPSNAIAAYGSALVYCNGTTDYVEMYGWLGTGQALTATATNTFFQGVMVRGA